MWKTISSPYIRRLRVRVLISYFLFVYLLFSEIWKDSSNRLGNAAAIVRALGAKGYRFRPLENAKNLL